jgi:hypothetical protein
MSSSFFYFFGMIKKKLNAFLWKQIKHILAYPGFDSVTDFFLFVLSERPFNLKGGVMVFF